MLRRTPLPVLDGPAVSAARKGKAVCPYCGVGCVLTATVEGNRVTRIRADPADAPNFGMMCPKGALAGRVFDDPERLTHPMIRREKGGPLEPVSWEEAIAKVADALRETGPERVAWYGSGQLDTEASYAFTKLFKGVLGSNHTDTNSRLCMSSAVAGYAGAFGSDGPPTCYEDLDLAETFLIVGANMAANHPVLFNRVRRRQATCKAAKIVVVDPRRTRTAAHADVHLAVAPGGDVPLLRFLARWMLDGGEVDEAAFAEANAGGAAWLERLRAEDPADLAERSGVPVPELAGAAALLTRDRKLLSLYCMGANQSAHGTHKNRELIHLTLLLGQLGRPGCGPFSLTGQPNAMGGREVGYLAHQLPGYRFVTDAADREAVERFWGTVRGAISPTPGRSAVEMFARAAAGGTDVLWVACTNPVASLPEAERTRAALRRTPLVVVQDVTAASETVAYADVVLPALQWGEKAGTMTNSERLTVRSDRFLDGPAGARPDWWIAAAVGRALGGSLSANGFDWASNEDVWDEVRALSAGRPTDSAGMTNERLRAGPLQWPCPDADHPGTPRRYADGRVPTPDGRPRTAGEESEKYARSAAFVDAVDADFPLVLTTGRVASQWHSRTKTRLVPVLQHQESEPFFEVHPDDAAGFTDGDRVLVVGRRGRAEAVVRVTDAVRPGCVFSPFHWADSAGELANVNAVTSDAIDPESGQPELKACAVRLERAGGG